MWGIWIWLLLAGCSIAIGHKTETEKPPLIAGHYRSYTESIQPILNRRCAVCHSCNDSPCQLDQTAYAGVDRGASSKDVYADRLISDAPTRLFIDAQTTDEWRRRGFFPVIRHYPPGDQRNLRDSILYQLVSYRQFNPLPKMNFNAFSSRNCPNLDAPLPKLTNDIAALFNINAHADLGMPYGFPPLSEVEYSTLLEWLDKGAPGPDAARFAPPAELAHQSELTQWEDFLNGSSAKQRLVSRFLYEHLFYAHLHFSNDAESSRPIFYRLVRSRTSAPLPVEEIATRLPYDEPGTKQFFYRLRRIDATIVHKTHLPFELNPQRLQHIQALFLSSDWQITDSQLPTYTANTSGNPFITFQSIPAAARYRFMIENAEYFVATFMKGPVCRGQVALNVIDDHFFIFFLDPTHDQSVVDPDFLRKTAQNLVTPFRPADFFSLAASSAQWKILELSLHALEQLKKSFYPYYKSRQLQYLKERDRFYAAAEPNGPSLDDIWDGERWNGNAALTVFRHFDSASVTHGAVGGSPRTALVLDYPIFERMYYNLVASFDIYSDIKLQLAARLYMDDLRIEAEDLFLGFLPLAKRQSIRQSWYKKAESTINSSDYPFYGTTSGKRRETQIRYVRQDDFKDEFISQILSQRFSKAVRGPGDQYNAVRGPFQEPIGVIHSETDLDRELAKIGAKTGAFVPPLPDLMLIRFRPASGSGNELVYTFVHNREHFNVKYLFSEQGRLNTAEDTLSVIKGFHGSYPNIFFDVPLEQAQQFLTLLTSIRDESNGFQNLVNAFGIRRTDDKFWEISDWFAKRFRETDPVGAGLLDLNRYGNY
jgi:hypothetical protein